MTAMLIMPDPETGDHQLLFADSDMRIIIREDDDACEEDIINEAAHYLIGYYNNHYADDGKKINIKRTDRV